MLSEQQRKFVFRFQRLHEFGATPSAKLTIDEFLRIDLESEFDPPAFIKSQNEALARMEEDDLQEQIDQAEALVPQIEKDIQREEEKAQQE